MRTSFAVIAGMAVWLVPAAASACGCCDHHEQHASARTPAAAAQLGPGEVRVTIPVAGMQCGHCVSRVESALAKLDGVRLADASLEGGVAVVVFEKSKLKASNLVETINALGFKAGTPTQN